MLRKDLALSLVVSWLFLSGLDVWEDLHAYSQLELHSAAEPPDSSTAPGARLVNNIVETANNSRLFGSAFTHESAAQLAAQAPILRQKTSRIHLLNRVFLI